MKPSPSLSSLILLLALAPLTGAQTNFPEIEPNALKGEATLANGMIAGDTLTGLTIGSTVTSNNTASTTVDMFRVKTGALPLGVYRHTLVLTSATVGHSPLLRGLQQANGVITATDATIQAAAVSLTLDRSNMWYGFGKQEEIYYRVQGSAATSAAYTATLSTTPVTLINVPGTFSAGTITVSTANQGHTTDTELYLYDGNLDPVPLGHNDDDNGGGAPQSSVTVPLTAGTYYVGVSNYNTANNLPDLNPNEGWDDGSVMDFPNVMANSNAAVSLNVGFSITDGVNVAAVPATKNAVFEILWAVFTVSPASTTSTPFCQGDAVGTTCVACGNNGAAGHGCANSSFPGGALLTSSGIAGASAGTDTLTLTASDIPGPGLFFQANGLAASPVGFGDGMLCAAVGIIRMGVVFPTAGVASYPGGLTPNPIHVAGAPINAGDTKHYQCWYRDAAAFCTASTFNTSNGVSLTWVP